MGEEFLDLIEREPMEVLELNWLHERRWFRWFRAASESPLALIFRTWRLAWTRHIEPATAFETVASSATAAAMSKTDCRRLVRALRLASCLPADAEHLLAHMLVVCADQLRFAGMCEESLLLYDVALPVIADYGSLANYALCLMNRSCTQSDLGRYKESLEGFGNALRLLKTDGKSGDIAACLGNMGYALYGSARYVEALTCFDHALTKIKRKNNLDNWIQCQMGRANNLVRLGRKREALANYNSLLNLVPQCADPSNLVSLHANRATVLFELDMYEEALIGHDAALALCEKPGVDFATIADRANCHMNRANVLNSLNRDLEALDAYDIALNLLPQCGRPEELARCQMNRAALLAKMGRLQDAKNSWSDVDRSTLNLDDLSLSYSYSGDVLWSSGQCHRALEHYALARQILRRARRHGRIDDASLEFSTKSRAIVHESICREVQMGRIEEAFHAVQDGKGAVLGDLRERSSYGNTDESPTIHSVRERLVEWLRQPSSSQASDGHGAELNKRTQNYLRAWRQSRHDYNLRKEETGTTCESVRLDQVQRALPADWALLDFWRTGADEITVFVVFRDSLQMQNLVFPVVTKEALSSKFDRLLNSMLNPLALASDAFLDDLHTYLFAPLRRQFQERKIRGLYLVPHNFLHAVPLHASRWRENGEIVYLCDRYDVAYLPSAALLPQLPAVRLDGRMLSFANPERGTDNTLPFSDWEGRELSKLRPLAGLFHSGPEATFDRTAGWHDADLLHFSCHGLGDYSFAPRSHLRLADDLLLAHDVLYRRPPLVDGAMVVLNGCHTGVRDWTAVDEAMGLMSAFLLRGASLVLATQWSVFDPCAAEFVLSFLNSLLKEHTTPTDALRHAQTRVRKMKTEEIVARHDDVEKMFPANDFPHEAGKLFALKAWLCHRAGLHREARDSAMRAVAPLRRVGQSTNADLLQLMARGQAGFTSKKHQIANFDHPMFWSAFHLVGRVT